MSFTEAEKCGVFGAFVEGGQAASLVKKGLSALNHRGYDNAGIVSNRYGKGIITHKGDGAVTQVFAQGQEEELVGNIASGHVRYETNGGSGHIQPIISEQLALSHNGNFPSLTKPRFYLEQRGINTSSFNDSEMMHAILDYHLKRGCSLVDAVRESHQNFTGSYSLILMTPTKLAALRDGYGIRPLAIGSLGDRGWVFSSETCGLDRVGASFVREVEPGELVVADHNGLESHRIEPGKENLCLFEFAYFAKGESRLFGRVVNDVRRDFGRTLAQEHPVEADVVISVPDTANAAAWGYAEALGIPFSQGLRKNPASLRTFIRPSQASREAAVREKFIPVPEVIEDRVVTVIDDSIVRATTSRWVVKLLRDYGAKVVQVLSASPEVRYPDFYGINTPSQRSLIAANKSIEEMRRYLEADYLGFLSLEGMLKATNLPPENFCTSCFSGHYPIDIGERKTEIRELVPLNSR